MDDVFAHVNVNLVGPVLSFVVTHHLFESVGTAGYHLGEGVVPFIIFVYLGPIPAILESQLLAVLVVSDVKPAYQAALVRFGLLELFIGAQDAHRIPIPPSPAVGVMPNKSHPIFALNNSIDDLGALVVLGSRRCAVCLNDVFLVSQRVVSNRRHKKLVPFT